MFMTVLEALTLAALLLASVTWTIKLCRDMQS